MSKAHMAAEPRRQQGRNTPGFGRRPAPLCACSSKGTAALAGTIGAELESGSGLRPVQDRIRQTLMYETGGLLVVSPLFSYSAGVSAAASASLLTALALVVAVWTAAFNTIFDSIELHRSGLTADQRSTGRRILHAGLLEGGAVVITTPVIALWTGLGWPDALAQDIGLTAVYMVYAYLFGLIYDRAYPLSEASSIEPAGPPRT